MGVVERMVRGHGGMRSRLACILALSVGFGSAAIAQETSSARVAALIAYLQNPDSRFTVRSALAGIADAEKDTGPDSLDRGRLERLRSIIARKGDKRDESIKAGLEALRIDAASPFLSSVERAWLHGSIASQAEADCALAMPHLEQAIATIKSEPVVNHDEVLGLQAHLAACLRQAGHPDEARKLNQSVLAVGTMLYGPESLKLAGVLASLVQDSYVLHDLNAMRGYLDRLLAIGLKSGDANAIDTALFQLGVLDFEMGHAGDARAHMQRRLDLATASGDADRIKRAKGDLDVLIEKQAGR